jgi:hypothetical protein
LQQGRKHTFLNGPTVSLRPIPTLVWQRGEGLDGVLIRLSINHLVGAIVELGKTYLVQVERVGEINFLPAVRTHLEIS